MNKYKALIISFAAVILIASGFWSVLFVFLSSLYLASSLLKLNLMPNQMMLSVFWPLLISVLFLILYVFTVWDFYHHLFGPYMWDSLYLISTVICLLVLPVIGLLQLGYGIFKTLKKKDKFGRFHIYSSIGVFTSFVLFYIMAISGFIITV